MAAAAPIAAVASVASIGLSAMGSIEKGEGQKAAADYQAAQAEQAAQFGRLQATLTDTTMRERLTTTLGNIDSIRAAGNVDPSSPTTAAVESLDRKLSDRQRIASDVTQRSQADADEASAAYLKKSGDFALNQGYLSAAAGAFGGIAKGFGSGGGGMG